MDFGQDRWPYLVWGALGAIAFAMVKVGLNLLKGQWPSAHDALLLAGNIALGVMVGVMCSFALGPALATVVPFAGLRDPGFVGFVIGATAWEAFPAALEWSKRWINNRSKGS